ncbi:MAG TPA: hypothetical protein VF783_19770 [Terriglobales bacterium]
MRLADSTFVEVAHYPSSFSGIIQHRCVIFLLAMACILPARIRAQESPETVVVDKQTLQQMLQRIDQLEAKVNQLEAERASSPTLLPEVPVAEPNLAVPSASSHIVADTSDDSKSYPSDPEKMDVSKTMLHIRGFADFGLGGSTQKEGSAAFTMGELNLFITSNISDRLKFLSEIVFENEDEGQYSSQYSGRSNDFTVDVERALLEYSYNDYLNLAIGRYHTAIGYYNTAYHHSAWVQTALGRPLLFAFEDEGGILPLHEVGVSVSGRIPSGDLGLHYVAEVGNGWSTRTPINSVVEMPLNVNNHEAENIALFVRPDNVPGLQAGFSLYREMLSPTEKQRIRETIWDAYVMLARGKFEWLNEGLVIRHNVLGTSDVYETPGFYTQLSKRFGSYTPYFLYQYINAPVNEPIFPDVGLRTGPSLGVRFDATESIAFKLQYDYTALRRQPGINSLGLQVGFTF